MDASASLAAVAEAPIDSLIDDLEVIFRERGAHRYEIGGAGGAGVASGVGGVSQLEHALQCAALAEQAQAGDALVAAALLHDLGHLIQGDDGELDHHRDDVHQYIALPFLRRAFGPEVLEPIRLHVDAKRYLCAVDPAYYDALSVGSRRSLELQGGPFDAAQASAFIQRPYAADAVALRRWDDRAKQPGAAVPPFAAYRALLRAAALERSVVRRGD